MLFSLRLDVVAMIKNASNAGVLRLTISPSNIKPLSKPNSKTKSLPSLNDERMYTAGGAYPDGYNNSSWSPYDGSFGGQPQQAAPSSIVKYMSTSRLDNAGISPRPYQERPYSAHGFDSYRPQVYRPAPLTSQPYLPSDPWPRKYHWIGHESFFIPCRYAPR